MKYSVLLIGVLLLAGCVGQASSEKFVEPSVMLKTPVIFDAETGKPFNVEWNVTSKPIKIDHTAVHYGNAHMLLIGESLHIAPSDTVYSKLTRIQSGDVPADFKASITPQEPGLLYGRAHAIVDGINYWSDEFVVTVKGDKIVPKPVESPTNEFVIKADDDGFDPASIEVKNNSKVNITFHFDDRNIYFGGLDISGGDLPTIKYKKGSNRNESVEFVASQSFTLTSYWPATGVVKGTLGVVVS